MGTMLSRLLLAAALLAPQASSWLHAFEVAEAEADHPVCTAGASAHLEPTSNHAHHDEGRCSQFPRPSQAAPTASATLAAVPPAPRPDLADAADRPASPDAAASPRGPPAVLSA